MVNALRGEGERLEPYADGVVNRICEGGRNAAVAQFAGHFCAVRSEARRRHENGPERRQIAHRRKLVLTKAQRGDFSALIDRQLFHEGTAEAIHKAAVDLSLMPDGTDDLTDVGNEEHIGDMQRTGLDIDIDIDRE